MRFKAFLAAALLVTPCLGALNETGFGVNTLEMLTPPSASPSASMAPTAPTSSPTDSPVPSPSPSAIPTGIPTGTPVPTKMPSVSPTDSPVPSPSPSATPSLSPSASPSVSPSAEPSSSPSARPSSVPSSSPSALPSSSPSSSPSAQPTISAAPSSVPSTSPSDAPSSVPSASPSSAPSVSSAPSASPSISSAPSFAPSLLPSSAPSPESVEMSALVSVNLENLLTGMTDDIKDMFEQQTQEFIQLELPNATEMGATVEIISVKVVEQSIITPGRASQANSDGRRHRFLLEEGLKVRMNVTGEVSPGHPPDDFDFAEVVSIGFAQNYLVYAYRLSSADPFFNLLLGDGVEARSAGPESEDEGGNNGSIIGIVIGCVAAVGIAGAAAYFAIKHRQRSSSSFQKPIDSISSSNLGLEQSSSRDLSIGGPASPNALENGRALGIARKDSMASSVASSPTSSIHSERILGIRAHAISPNNVETMLVAANSRPTTIQIDGGSGRTNDEASLDGKLKNDVMMSHGAARRTKDPPISQSEFAMLDDQSTEHANRQSGGPCCAAAPCDMGGLLGARGMDSGEEQQYNERLSDEATPAVKRTGLYDVFAPPGPLGIVVDTTKDGPVIHSLKASSALLGLVGSGDLIVGLDDEDTRSMTAATLTRMMAKRSHNPERKISLLSMDHS